MSDIPLQKAEPAVRLVLEVPIPAWKREFIQSIDQHGRPSASASFGSTVRIQEASKPPAEPKPQI